MEHSTIPESACVTKRRIPVRERMLVAPIWLSHAEEALDNLSWKAASPPVSSPTQPAGSGGALPTSEAPVAELAVSDRMAGVGPTCRR